MSHSVAKLLDDQTADSKTRLRLWLRLLGVSKRIEAALREGLRQEFDTTLPRFDVLAALDRFDQGLKMSELSGVLKVSNGNVTGIVDRLLEEGLLIRVPVDGDRRALLVRLTQKGREQFALLAAKHEQWVDGMLSEVTPQDAELLIEKLDLTMNQSVNKAINKGGLNV